MLPLGETNVPSQKCVKLFCPRCQEAYQPYSKQLENIDGAFFGTGFPQAFMLNFPEFKPEKKAEFTGRVFGFIMHESSPNHPAKVQFNLEKNTLEVLPRPKAIFSADDRRMKEKMEKRGPLIVQKSEAVLYKEDNMHM